MITEWLYYASPERLDLPDISKLENDLRSPTRNRNLQFSLINTSNKNPFQITNEVVMAMLNNFSDFTFTELRENIYSFNGSEKVSPTTEVVEYLDKLESLNYLKSIPKINMYVSFLYGKVGDGH